ncbi:MAG: penicillin-binding protein [Myxococcales bacterium]|nr:penicillin-binding protein [Myxococcales bacterium]
MSEEEELETAPQKPARRWLKVLLILFLVGLLLAAGAVGGVIWHFSKDLPRVDTLAEYRPPLITRVYSRDGEQLLAEFCEERRTLVPYKEVPEHVRHAFLAAEDSDFFNHDGVDYLGILRAVFKNLVRGGRVQGASTITQQTARAFLLHRRKTYTRKIREIMLTWKIEERFNKEEIFYLYLNHIYFGACLEDGFGCYGVQEASRRYFGKDVQELTLAEGAVLASLPKAPNKYNPRTSPDEAKKRRDWVLSMMVKKKFAAADAVAAAKEEPVLTRPTQNPYYEKAPYYSEHVRQILEEEYGRETLYKGGLNIRASVDLGMQRAARKALMTGLERVDRAQGYRGPLYRPADEAAQVALGKAIEATAVQGGQILDLQGLAGEEPPKDVAGAIRVVSVAPGLSVGARVTAIEKQKTRRGRQRFGLLDMGGGRKGRVNLSERAWQKPLPGRMPKIWGNGQRPYTRIKAGDIVLVRLTKVNEDQSLEAQLIQKPRVQGALIAIDPRSRDVLAMVGGYSFLESPFNRAVQSRRQPGSAFKPLVYAAGIQSRRFTPATMITDQPTTFRDAVKGTSWKPKNYSGAFEGDISVRYCLTFSKNTCSIQIAESVGYDAIKGLARSVGIESRQPNDLTLSLGSGEVFPLELANAYATLAAGGKVAKPIFIAQVDDRFGEQLEANKAELRQVVDPAVSYLTLSLMRSVVESGTAQSVKALKRDVAGKTGTTNEQRSAWFVGAVPELVTAVYLGFDNNDPLGPAMTGGGIAAPIWLEFMKAALDKESKERFAVPPGVVFARIDPKTGLLAPEGAAGARQETFLTGTAPKEMTSIEEQTEADLLDEEY